jgi:hypothetical protein
VGHAVTARDSGLGRGEGLTAITCGTTGISVDSGARLGVGFGGNYMRKHSPGRPMAVSGYTHGCGFGPHKAANDHESPDWGLYMDTHAPLRGW